MPEVLTVLSGREAIGAQARRTCASSYGDAPQGWYPALTGAPWPGLRRER